VMGIFRVILYILVIMIQISTGHCAKDFNGREASEWTGRQG
jgi:hypothetical protein